MFESVVTCLTELKRALAAPSTLDDGERVDAIRALEELVCVATAAQASLAADLDRSQRELQRRAGVPERQLGRGVAAQVALARRESPHRGQRHLGLARIVSTELPRTWEAWRAGRITEWKATLIARETACLTREDRRSVDEAVAAGAERVEQMGVRELVAACQREAYRLDPESYVSRRRLAEADRRVTLRPAPDAMTWLTALLPVKDGVAAHVVLTRAADSARAAGDPRPRGQVMADTLVASVLGAAAGRDDDVTSWHRSDTPAPSCDTGASVDLGLVMTDAALFGRSDEPAHVPGYGPIPAELAREIVANACAREEEVWLRRLYASPRTGELVAMEARSRSFPAGLSRFIRLRDQTCRTPWCDAPVRHGDHAEDHATGGATSAENGQGLCVACNHAKQAPGWRAGPARGPGHQIETATPTGHRHRSRAPAAVATIRGTPFLIDYVVAS